MGNKAFDVTALGELLIDFTENGSSAQGNPMLEANPGGAPCNVLAMLEKLGKKTAFIGKVGNDMFGTQLKNAVEEVGILVADLARSLGYPGAMKWLTRLESGGFTLDQTLSLNDIQDAVAHQTINRHLYPIDYA